MVLSFLQKLVGCKECPSDNSADLAACENTLSKVTDERDALMKQVIGNAVVVDSLKAHIVDLTIALSENPSAVHPKEKYWNEKYPKDDSVRYTCRYVHLKSGKIEAIQVDPRIFFQPYAGDLKGMALGIKAYFKLKNKRDANFDELALECLRFVRKNIKYTSDKDVEGIEEYWQDWTETWELKTGDCEDGSIFLANLLLACGIPYWRVRLNAGTVNGGGHAYVTYCRETDDEFVVLDWCYWPNDKPVSERALHRDEENYSGHDYGIWWSFNLYYIFRKVVFASDA